MNNTFKDFLYNSDRNYKTIGKSFAQRLMEAKGDSKEGYEYEESGKTYRVIKHIKDGKTYYTKQEKTENDWGKEEPADEKRSKELIQKEEDRKRELEKKGGDKLYKLLDGKRELEKKREEDRKRELEKKREDKLLDSKRGNEKREPSEAKKTWDSVVDKMSGSNNIFSMIIGNTAKLITGVMASILPPNPSKINKMNDEMDEISIAKLQKMMGENSMEGLSDEEKEAVQKSKEDLDRVVDSMKDENGNPLSPEERLKKLKGDMSDEEFEEWKNKHVDTFNKVKDNPEFKEFFDKNDNLSEDEIKELRARIHDMEEEARNPEVKKIRDKRDKALKEESENGKNDQKVLDDEHNANLEGLENFENDVKNAQKELDDIKKEDDESDEMFEARKKQAKTKLNQAVKSHNDKKGEIESYYKDKCSKLRKSRIEARKEINEDFEKEMKDAGRDTVKTLAEKAKEEEKNSDDFDKDNDEYSNDMEDDASEEIEKVPKVDPRKIWKQRKRKDGNGKTTSYWNKKGNAKISEKEFKEKCKIYDKKHNPSESLVNHMRRCINESITEYLKK